MSIDFYYPEVREVTHTRANKWGNIRVLRSCELYNAYFLPEEEREGCLEPKMMPFWGILGMSGG